jgi:hypothetical protein
MPQQLPQQNHFMSQPLYSIPMLHRTLAIFTPSSPVTYFARYHRLRSGLPSNGTGGEHVQFLAGTDEHGLKIQKASQKHFGMAGREKEFCDSLTERFRVSQSDLLSFDAINCYL